MLQRRVLWTVQTFSGRLHSPVQLTPPARGPPSQLKARRLTAFTRRRPHQWTRCAKGEPTSDARREEPHQPGWSSARLHERPAAVTMSAPSGGRSGLTQSGTGAYRQALRVHSAVTRRPQAGRSAQEKVSVGSTSQPPPGAHGARVRPTSHCTASSGLRPIGDHRQAVTRATSGPNRTRTLLAAALLLLRQPLTGGLPAGCCHVARSATQRRTTLALGVPDAPSIPVRKAASTKICSARTNNRRRPPLARFYQRC